MRSRRLDDRIRELCASVVALKDRDDLDLILPELRAAIHQSIERLRIRAVGVLSGRRDFPNERAQNLLNVLKKPPSLKDVCKIGIGARMLCVGMNESKGLYTVNPVGFSLKQLPCGPNTPRGFPPQQD